MLPSPTLEGQHAIPMDVLNDAKGSKKRRGVFFGVCEKDQVIIIDLYCIVYIYDVDLDNIYIYISMLKRERE